MVGTWEKAGLLAKDRWGMRGGNASEGKWEQQKQKEAEETLTRERPERQEKTKRKVAKQERSGKKRCKNELKFVLDEREKMLGEDWEDPWTF